MTKAALYQAAMGNTGQNQNTSLYLKHQDREDKLYRRELYLAISSSPVTKQCIYFLRCTAIYVEKKISSSALGRLDDPSRVPS